MSHCLCLALPSFPLSLDQHACPQQLINQTRLGSSFARAVSFLQKKIIRVSLFLPKPMAKSQNHVICQLDMVLCKEKLEKKEYRQKQVLEYEGSSGTEGLKEAWKLHVLLVASGAFPSLQLTHSTDTRLVAFERRQHLSSEN